MLKDSQETLGPRQGAANDLEKISVQAWGQNYVQAIQFYVAQNTMVGSFESQNAKGKFDDFRINSGQRIIGVYGYTDKKNDIRGIGFIVACGLGQ
jgi:hypothetical protein